MKCMVPVAVLVALGGCGATTSELGPYQRRIEVSHASAPGEPLPADEAGLRGLMLGPVTLGGLAFADRACVEQFGAPRVVPVAELAALAHCLGALHWAPSARKTALDHGVVMTYAPGYEVEAYVAFGQLGYVGFTGRGGTAPAVPTMTPEALEALRTAGEPHPRVPLAHRRWLEICVFPGSAAPKVYARSPVPADELAQLGAAIGDWKFRKFAVPACAIVAFDPAGRAEADDTIPRPLTFAKSGKAQRTADLRKLAALRVGGTAQPWPTEAIVGAINRDQHALHRAAPVVGAFELCLDEDGRFASGEMLKSTGYHAYDAYLVHALEEWTIRPYIEDGAAQPVCATITVRYEQSYR